MTETVCIPVSVGELIDKISILNVKRVMISDLQKVEIVKKELIELMDMASPYLQTKEVEDLYDQLIIVNKNLWDVEDELRHLESEKKFDEEFVGKARSVYYLNDRRYELKNSINVITNSKISEVKQHVEYR
jgi:predicted nuclease with TOPRIM domain